MTVEGDLCKLRNLSHCPIKCQWTICILRQNFFLIASKRGLGVLRKQARKQTKWRQVRDVKHCQTL